MNPKRLKAGDIVAYEWLDAGGETGWQPVFYINKKAAKPVAGCGIFIEISEDNHLVTCQSLSRSGSLNGLETVPLTNVKTIKKLGMVSSEYIAIFS